MALAAVEQALSHFLASSIAAGLFFFFFFGGGGGVESFPLVFRHPKCFSFQKKTRALSPCQRRRERVEEQGSSLPAELVLQGPPGCHPARGVADDVLEAAKLLLLLLLFGFLAEQAEGDASDFPRKHPHEQDAAAPDSSRVVLLLFDE